MNLIDILYERNIITDEDISTNKPQQLHGLQSIEHQTNNGIVNIAYSDFRSINEENMSSILSGLTGFREELETGEKIFNLYIFFNDWEQERQVLNELLKNAKNAKERRDINDIYSFMTPIYVKVPDTLALNVDQEGINYLEFQTQGLDMHIDAKIFNVSMEQLKKLYKVTGKHLFRQNVRVGIEQKKGGKQPSLKEEFKNYLKVGLVNYTESTETKETLKEYFDFRENIYKKFTPELFWYKHNGINIFMNEKAEFKTDTDCVIIDPQKVSVINGAQTLTNFFIAEEELLQEIQTGGLKVADIKGLVKQVLKSIMLKTVFIKGTDSLAKTITWGLNNQIPISSQDFISISAEVDELNELLKKYQLRILKTGEIEKIYTGVTPLEFMKLFFIVKGEPGKSKNFNKSNLGESISQALKDVNKQPDLLKKIDVAFEVEKWWNKIYRNSDEKSVFLRYGKNYFQSFIIYLLDKNNNLNFLLDSDLNVYYQELESIIESVGPYDINDFKSDKLFSAIKKKFEDKKNLASSSNLIDKNIREYMEKLTTYVRSNKENNYSISATIKRFNAENNIELDYFRTISYLNGKVKESFPLPNSTFEEFYKQDKYLEQAKYPNFENSLFLKEINRRYPIYVIYLDENKEVRKVKFALDFSISLGKDYKKNAEKAFSDVKKAFEMGDSNLFPKLSSDIGFHVRPKAINGNDTFRFTDGTDITKRTFWANANYVRDILIDNNLVDE